MLRGRKHTKEEPGQKLSRPILKKKEKYRKRRTSTPFDSHAFFQAISEKSLCLEQEAELQESFLYG